MDIYNLGIILFKQWNIDNKSNLSKIVYIMI